MESSYEAGGAPAPPHLHPGQDERFTVLAGAVETEVDGEERTLREGDVARRSRPARRTSSAATPRSRGPSAGRSARRCAHASSSRACSARCNAAAEGRDAGAAVRRRRLRGRLPARLIEAAGYLGRVPAWKLRDASLDLDAPRRRGDRQRHRSTRCTRGRAAGRPSRRSPTGSRLAEAGLRDARRRRRRRPLGPAGRRRRGGRAPGPRRRAASPRWPACRSAPTPSSPRSRAAAARRGRARRSTTSAAAPTRCSRRSPRPAAATSSCTSRGRRGSIARARATTTSSTASRSSSPSGSSGRSRSASTRRRSSIDPGLDFDLTADDDLEILRRLERAARPRPAALRLALAQGLHRRGPRRLVGGPPGRGASAGSGTIAAAALAAAEGAQIHRLHDPEALDAIRVAGRIAARLTRRWLSRALDLPWGSAIDEAWRAAIDPGRADGRLVAESAERELEANEVPLPDAARPRPARGARAQRRQRPSTPTSSRRCGRRRRRT